MIWPERPTCHDEDRQAARFRQQWTWERRAPDARNPDGEPFRRCSYCGSIHPEDLIQALENGAQLGGSDWKYGWPRKFYISSIPNPNRDRQAEIGSLSYWDEEKGERVDQPTYGAEGDFHAKWYNQHLKDAGYDDEAIGRLTQLLEQHSGITFYVADGKLMFRAPHFGYQR